MALGAEGREGSADAPAERTGQTSHQGRGADDAGQGWSSDDEGGSGSHHPETEDGPASVGASVQARSASSLSGDEPELCEPAVPQQENNYPEPEESCGPA